MFQLASACRVYSKRKSEMGLLNFAPTNFLLQYVVWLGIVKQIYIDLT